MQQDWELNKNRIERIKKIIDEWNNLIHSKQMTHYLRHVKEFMFLLTVTVAKAVEEIGLHRKSIVENIQWK